MDSLLDTFGPGFDSMSPHLKSHPPQNKYTKNKPIKNPEVLDGIFNDLNFNFALISFFRRILESVYTKVPHLIRNISNPTGIFIDLTKHLQREINHMMYVNKYLQSRGMLETLRGPNHLRKSV